MLEENPTINTENHSELRESTIYVDQKIPYIF